MKLLLHTCCAPCTIYPLKILREQNHRVTGYFYNSNIHPYREFDRRKAALEEYAQKAELKVLFNPSYDLEEFLSQTRPWGPDRCRPCFRMRLTAAAQQARTQAFEAFTTTLLYSRYQKHDWIREEGEEIGSRYQIPFYYQDFRAGWNEGVKESKALGLYRQPYCGCIFSEKERFRRNRPQAPENGDNPN
jgi:predicted adenine nucleotide alpha hydrolase (AANH) superfamily ATPase